MPSLTLRSKLILSGVSTTLFPLLIIATIALWQGNATEEVATLETHQLGLQNQEHIAAGIVSMLISQQEVLEHKIVSDLRVAHDILQRRGELKFGAPLDWVATNQFSQEKTSLQLPQMGFGNTWLVQNSDANQPSPIVDDTRKLVGGTTTIFQRMNAAGDMLRVSTNVIAASGKRAVGTYIPVMMPNGTPNPVLAIVLKKETFVGRAFVVDRWYVTAYEPILDPAGQVVGILYVGIPEESATSLRQQIMGTKVGTTGYVYILDSKGNYVISHKGERDGENIMEAKDADGRLFIQDIIAKALPLQPGEFATDRYPWKNATDPAPRYKTVAIAYFAPWDWVIGVGTYDEEFMASVEHIRAVNSNSRRIMGLAIVVCTILLLLAWLVLAGKITRPVLRTVDMLKNISQGEGDLTQRLQVESHDEIGQLAEHFNHFVSRIQTIIREMGENASTLASSSTELATVATQMNEGSAQNSSRSAAVATAAEEMSVTTISVANGMDQASSSLNSVASATEEMSATVHEVATHAERARSVTVQAAQQAEGISAIMDALSNSVQEIGSVTATISEISAQTNLLALNATIEAASAGEAGKGFAVVASEVKELARQTAKATSEIQQKVEAIQNSSGGAIADMNKIRAIISDTQELVSTIAAAIEQQATTTQDIARNISLVNQEMQGAHSQVRQTAEVSRTIAADISEVHQTAESMNGASQQVNNSSQELSHLAEQLRSIVGRFRV